MFGDNNGHHQHSEYNKRERINKFDDEKREKNIIFLHPCFVLIIKNLVEETQGFKSLSPIHYHLMQGNETPSWLCSNQDHLN
jgi:hypothetical protein